MRDDWRTFVIGVVIAVLEAANAAGVDVVALVELATGAVG